MGKLTVAKIRSLKAPGWYGDGGTLYLCVSAGGSKSFVQRLTIDGVRRDIGHGPWPLTELPRVSRRLQPLRDWSDETLKQILPGTAGTGSAVGPGPPGRARIAMGRHRPRPKRRTITNSNTRRRPRDSHKMVSGIPGAVHTVSVDTKDRAEENSTRRLCERQGLPGSRCDGGV